MLFSDCFCTEVQLTPLLKRQIGELEEFLTFVDVPERKGGRIRFTTWRGYKRYILLFMGWLHNIEKMPMDNIDLKLMAHDGSSEPRKSLDRFIAWGINRRDNSYKWASKIAAAALNVAKCFFGQASRQRMFRDIPEVEAIR